jgi:hypothetical protein
MENKSATGSARLAQVRPWHRAMARMVAAGARPGEIAESFGYSPCQISIIIGSPLFQAEVSRLESQADAEAISVRQDLQIMSTRAIEVLDEALETPVKDWQDRAKRIDAAFGVLDRAGYGKKEQPQEHKHLHLHAEVKQMSDEELLKDVLDLTNLESVVG